MKLRDTIYFLEVGIRFFSYRSFRDFSIISQLFWNILINLGCRRSSTFFDFVWRLIPFRRIKAIPSRTFCSKILWSPLWWFSRQKWSMEGHSRISAASPRYRFADASVICNSPPTLRGQQFVTGTGMFKEYINSARLIDPLLESNIFRCQFKPSLRYCKTRIVTGIKIIRDVNIIYRSKTNRICTIFK